MRLEENMNQMNYSNTKDVSLNQTKLYKWIICIIALDFCLVSLCQLMMRILPGTTIWDSGFKYVSALEFVICILFAILYPSKFKANGITLLFALELISGCLIGVINHQFNTKFLVHIYAFLMPIFAMSMGYWLLTAMLQNKKLILLFHKCMIFCCIAYCFMTILFNGFRNLNMTNFSAYGSYLGALCFAYFMTGKKKLDVVLTLSSIIAIIISGKRTPLVIAVIAYAIYVVIVKKNKKQLVITLTITIIGSCVAFYLISRTPYLTRILQTINSIFGETANLTAATGGRNDEIKGVINMMNSDKVSWLLGWGFGIINGTRHYVHFCPMGYAMVGGVIVSGILYTLLFITVIKLFAKMKRGAIEQTYLFVPFFFIEVILFSFSSASIFNSCYLWIFIGMGIGINKIKTYKM